MQFQESVLLAIDALRNNLVRTLLTMLGIIIGIASVIIIISLGQGATSSIVSEISSFGANVITIMPGRIQRRPGSGPGSTSMTLTLDDAEALRQIAQVTAVSGVVSTQENITAGSTVVAAQIEGVNAEYNQVQSLSIASGSFFSEAQNTSAAKVLVIGDEVATELLGEGTDPVGQTVRVGGKTFRIIGSITDSSTVYAPLQTVQKLLIGQTYLSSISLSVSDTEQVELTQTAVEEMLLVRHSIQNADDADFSVRSAQEMISSISSVTGTMTAMLSGIAAISLVVGGIGIMNIMLVTVTERTKEIGLLKAIGARKSDILSQFLIESIVLTLAGGLVGLLLGILITYVATQLISLPFVISLTSILLAIGVSTGVGIIFGWYPARRAAALQPIDALRHE